MMGVNKPKQFSGFVVECEDCGFVYSAKHELIEGGYDCPQCNDWGSVLERNQLKNKLRKTEQKNKLMREALKDIMDLNSKRLGKSSLSDVCYNIAEEALKGGGE